MEAVKGAVGGVEGGVVGGFAGGIVGGLEARRRRHRRRHRLRPRRSASAVRSSRRRRSRTSTLCTRRSRSRPASRALSSSKRRSAPSGKVTDAKVLRSIPLLDAAALDAVTVGVHADHAQRRAGAGHHDGHSQLHAAIDDEPEMARRDRARSTRGVRCAVDGGWTVDLMAMWRSDGIRRQGRGLRALLHVDVVVRRGHRAHLHVSRRRATSRSCTRRRWPST